MSRKTPFQLPHALEFGLLISGRDTKSLVTSVMCRFYIVAQLFFRPDDDLDMLSLEKSMALFKKVPDTTTSYCITIRNLKRFELPLDHTSIGLSFRQTSAVIDQHKEAFGNAKLVGLNDHIVSQYVCVGVAINLQHISDILSSPRIWSFALAADSSTHRSVSYLDIRICVCPNGSLENLHLIAVPFYDRHTAENIAAMICHILDALYARWRSKIIAFSTDGENTMTGRHACVVTRIDHECETKLMRICTCPKDTNRWVHLERMLSWMLEHRRQLLIWIDEKKPASAPDDSWWLMTGGVRPLLELVNVTLVILQSPNLILSQQTSEIENLVGHLVSTMNMELVGTDDAFDAMQASEFIVVDHWRVKIENVSRHLRNQGSWARSMFLVLDAANQTSILKEIAHFGLKLVQGISAIQAERNSNNEAALNFGIPVMPFQLVEMAPCDFIDSVLDPYRSQLAKFWPDEKIDLIERHQQELFNAYKREPGSKLLIDKQDHTTFFNTGWDDLKGRFEHLRMFCGGLANAFANITSVESDFSILKWEKDDFR
ncbi:unnamed protein product [Sphagnum troendelagicum]